MPGPTLTPGEEAAILSAIETIRAAQAARERPAQVLPGDGAALIALGIPAQLVDAAAAAGFVASIDEYHGPTGPGWTLRLHLTRGGQRWRFTHHAGPEMWRDAANGWVLAPAPIGGA